MLDNEEFHKKILSSTEVNSVDVDQAKSTLSGIHMYALSELFRYWSEAEERLTDTQRKNLMRISNDYKIIADSVGRNFKPPSNQEDIDLMRFIAEIAITHQYSEVHTDLPSADLYPTKNDIDEYISKLSEKAIEILENSDDPIYLREQMLKRAIDAGYGHYNSIIRTETYEYFVSDLITENPYAYSWAESAIEIVNIDNIYEDYQILDALDPIIPWE